MNRIKARLEKLAEEIEPIGIFVVCNSLSILVYEAESDYVIAGWSNEKETQTLELQYNADGDPFFVLDNYEVNLNEVMKI